MRKIIKDQSHFFREINFTKRCFQVLGWRAFTFQVNCFKLLKILWNMHSNVYSGAVLLYQWLKSLIFFRFRLKPAGLVATYKIAFKLKRQLSIYYTFSTLRHDHLISFHEKSIKKIKKVFDFFVQSIVHWVGIFFSSKSISRKFFIVDLGISILATRWSGPILVWYVLHTILSSKLHFLKCTVFTLF